MNRILILFFLLLSCMEAETKITHSLQKYDPNLAKAFEAFWGSYAKKEAESMYALELPYFHYLYPFDQYRAYVNTLHIPLEVVSNGLQIDENGLIELRVTLIFNENNATIADKWLKFHGEYRHKTEHFLLFKE